MENDLISRSALLEGSMAERYEYLLKQNGIYDHYTNGFEDAMLYIEDAPTVDPESLRPKGWWIDAPDMDEFWGELVFHKCSLCDELQYGKTNFCPMCGADMREG